MRLLREVKLRFFEDDANGEWGLAHAETLDNRYGSSFNAFWNDIGIFHDVFEHWHEFTHKYFRGDNAMNIGGEMAAMGAMTYYIGTLGVYKRDNNRNGMYWWADVMRKSTQDMIEEAIESDNNQFGHVLECGVPRQKPVYCGDLEGQIATYWDEVKKMIPGRHEERSKEKYPELYERAVENGRDMKNSITLGKIADLHRWGFRQAERDVEDNPENLDMMNDFLEFWGKFTAIYEAEEVARHFQGITFKIYKHKGITSWVAQFEPQLTFGEVTDEDLIDMYPLNHKLQIKSDNLPQNVMNYVIQKRDRWAA